MALCLWVVGMAQAEVPNPPLQHPIVFVAQIPPMRGYPSLNDVFTNHIASPEPAPRGSDLYILYPDGSLKNLTAAAGWGCTQPICEIPGSPSQPGYPEAQDPKGNLGGIAVRDPERRSIVFCCDLCDREDPRRQKLMAHLARRYASPEQTSP